ncbi:integrase [Pseudomonas sp. CBMAI 2609]|uniref:Integrase n=1 Tax=Pseudomonas flavocrustae TaxID=2991719 RepID=A0ABT6IN27_9PSED|nr:integrase [Pseudomonas sp. CBMAI 2609]MDH4765862.1 integrase [Pseudomonas sp. CBMAI 2609]
MAELLLFSPKAERDARSNLEDFIEMCRDRLTVFGESLDWNSNTWPKVGNFTVKGAPSRGFTDDQYLNSEILPFAKAYVRYQQGLNPSKLINELKAIRCIEPALLTMKGKADITLVDISVMDVAAQFAREYGATAYQAGSALAKLARFLNDSKIAPKRLEWQNPIARPKGINRTDKEAQDKRAGKLPDDLQLEGMAEMFANNPQHPRDRFTTSIFALLMCAPSRITEIQRLPLNVLHYEKDTKGIDRLGLRFFGGKGAGWDIKYVTTCFVEIAEEAVRRLTELSAEGRRLAKWYEENPSKFYRHDECPNVGEHEPLSDEQVCLALGLAWAGSKGVIHQFFKGYAPYEKQRKADSTLTLAFLNDYCHSVLPEGFPYIDEERKLKYSEALCSYRAHEFRLDLTTSRVKLWTPGKSLLTTDLNYIKGQERSIWTRHGYKNLDGSEVTMTSHQVRHLLNTAAQRGNLGQLDIAKWSARANIHQNATYNHMSEDEYVKLSENALPNGILEKVRQNSPVTLEDLEQVGDAIAHVTIFGFCVHDYSMLPCQKHRDCLNCSEHACIKGDSVKLKRLKEHRHLTQVQLDKAKLADETGNFGADRWSQHQLKTLQRLDQLIEIMESPEICEGSIIMLNNDQEHSPLKRDLAGRQGMSRLPRAVPDMPIMNFAMDTF